MGDKIMREVENWDCNVEKKSIGATAYYAIDFQLSKKLIPQYSNDSLVR